jgi:hypothetical protein
MTPRPDKPKKDSRSQGASSGGKSAKPPRTKRGATGDKTPSIGRAAARSGAVKGVRAKGGNTKGSRTAKAGDAAPGTESPKSSGTARPKTADSGSKSAYPKSSASGGRGAGQGGRGARSGATARSAGPGKSANAATAAANPGSYLNNCRKRALSVRTRRELGQQPRDVLVQLAIAHPVKTMRLGAIRQLTAGDSPRDVAALRLVERSIEAGPDVRAAASRGADIVQHRVDDL